MSSGPERSGEESKWSMPAPVFRSTKGRDLRAKPGSKGEEETPGEKDERKNMENRPQNISEATTDPQGENAIEKEAKGDKLGARMTLIGVLALVGAAILFLLVYFMFFWGRTPNS